MPAESPQNPTLLLGLGPFGAEVLELSAPTQGPRSNLIAAVVALGDGGPASPSARIDPAEPGGIEPLVTFCKEALRALLDLGHFVATTDPTDARGPRCDVFVVAELGEPMVAAVLPRLCAALATGLRAEFHAILRRGDGRLLVCPLLSVSREADRPAIAQAVRALARVASDPTPASRLSAPIYLAEDQSGKYLLSRAEAARSFAGFLRMLMFSRLRDAEAGVRRLVELEETRAGAPFATFACATLEFDHQALGRLCAVRLAREVLALFRSGTAASIGEIAAEASPIVPERKRLEAELWQEGSVGSLEQHLAPPAVEVPEIGWDDTPEDIVEHKFGPLWRARTAQRLGAYRDEVERFKMDRLADEIEHNGKETLERVERALEARVTAEVSSGPRGHARALEVLRDAHTRAKGYLEEVAAEVESPDLAEFPGSPLDGGVAAIVEAAFNRPRPWRMRALGLIAGGIAAFLFGAVIAAAVRMLFGDPQAFFDPNALPPGLPGLFARAPIPLACGAMLSVSSTGYRLWKHRRRHHNWVLEARDGLDQALKRFLSRDVVGYFYKRLHAARLLWVQRIYRRLTERIEEAMIQLETVRAALAHTESSLAREERGLDDRLDAGTARAGLLYRGLLTPADARAVYQDIRPVDVPPLGERFLREALADAPFFDVPFAEQARLSAFCARELSALETASPFAVDRSVLHRAAAEATRTFLRQLALKLSPPLALVETSAASARPLGHFAVVPPEAHALVERTLEEENLRGSWHLMAESRDLRRVQLLLERSELPLGALALAHAPGLDLPEPISARAPAERAPVEPGGGGAAPHRDEAKPFSAVAEEVAQPAPIRRPESS